MSVSRFLEEVDSYELSQWIVFHRERAHRMETAAEQQRFQNSLNG